MSTNQHSHAKISEYDSIGPRPPIPGQESQKPKVSLLEL
jgi:hypothetical protein